MISVQSVFSALKHQRFTLQDEKILQTEISDALNFSWIGHHREFRLDNESILDFFLPTYGIGMEVKIKGRPRSILRQCERYAAFPCVKELIVISNKSMGFPEQINGKPVYFLKLSNAWL